MAENINIKKTLLLLLFFIYENSFYGCNLIDRTLQGHSRYAVSLVFILYFFLARNKISILPKCIKQCFWVITSFPLISILNSFIFLNQPINLSIISWLGNNAHFLFLFVLAFYKIKINEIILAIRIFAIIYAILSIAQVVNPSFQILFAAYNDDGSLFMRNGIVRIIMPGGSFMLFAYIESLYHFLKNNKKTYFFLFIFFLVVIYLRQTRQLLFAIAFVSTIMIIYSFYKTRNKMQILTFVILLGTTVLVNFDSLFGSLISQTQDELGNDNYNRWVSYDYYFNEIFSNFFVFLLGVGKITLNTRFSAKLEELWIYEGISLNDIGIVGAWYTFGIIYILSYLRFCYLVIIKYSKNVNPLARYFVICTFCHCLFIFPLDDVALWACIFYISIKSIQNNDCSFNRNHQPMYKSSVFGNK